MIPPPVAGGAFVKDLLRRLAEHNETPSSYTQRKAPWQLIGFEIYPTVEEAKRRERILKHSPRMLTLFKKRLSRTAYPTTCRGIAYSNPSPFGASLWLIDRWWGYGRPRQVVG